MKKNLTLSFNHQAKYTKQAILINGAPIISEEYTPSFVKFTKIALLVSELIGPNFSVEKLARKLADSDEDGIDLAISAIICGDILTEVSPEFRANGAMLLITHLIGGDPLSVLIEKTQITGMQKYLNIEVIDHNEMYVLTTLISMIIFGMVLSTEGKMFHTE